jgi:hypothetical protein
MIRQTFGKMRLIDLSVPLEHNAVSEPMPAQIRLIRLSLLSCLAVSVHSSHTCRAKADCDLTSTARFAEEDSISVEMASGLLC